MIDPPTNHAPLDPCPFCGRSEVPLALTHSEPAADDPLGLGIPVAFYIGLGTGLVLAILAVLTGLIVAVA